MYSIVPVQCIPTNLKMYKGRTMTQWFIVVTILQWAQSSTKQWYNIITKDKVLQFNTAISLIHSDTVVLLFKVYRTVSNTEWDLQYMIPNNRTLQTVIFLTNLHYSVKARLQLPFLVIIQIVPWWCYYTAFSFF